MNAPGSGNLFCHLCCQAERLSLCSVCWNDWVLACREWAGQFYIYTYIMAPFMLCVCCMCIVCVWICKYHASEFVPVRDCVCVNAIMEHPDVSAASLGVCHWDSGVGLRWPVLNIESVTTTCPTRLIKAICIVSLFSHFFLLRPPERQTENPHHVLSLSFPLKCRKMSQQGFFLPQLLPVFLHCVMGTIQRHKENVKSLKRRTGLLSVSNPTGDSHWLS